MLGVVIQNLCEITILAEKAGMPRHAFLDFLNKSVMGSMFTPLQDARAGEPRFPRHLHAEALRKDLDLGLDAGREFEVPMPLTSLTRDLLQQMIGRGMTEQDFSTLLLMQGEVLGIRAQARERASSGWVELMYTGNRRGRPAHDHHRLAAAAVVVHPEPRAARVP
jgi:3-hydroxyisobutyrate dehydrogenase